MSPKEVAQLQRKAEDLRARYPHLRPGQVAWQALVALKPELAKELADTDADPFYVDGRLGKFWTRVAQS